ncbi:MAG: TrkA family potassium uptake protein [Methanosphaera stadtmanae]|nr:TrkA family potassium uptake protein [Methanosphaera stadtmanae]
MIGIIVGAGRIGYNLAKSLAENHDITIIDKDKEVCEKISDTLDCYVIQGTGTNTHILKEADVRKADFFVAATGNDEVNLLSSVYAKDHGVKKIVSRLNNTEHEDIFKKLKIKTVNPEKSATRFIARTIIRPSVQTLATLEEGDAEIIEVIVKNNNLLYTPISEIENNTDKYKILTLYSKDEIIIPTDNTEIGFEDSIAILVKSKYLDEIRNYFTLDIK